MCDCWHCPQSVRSSGGSGVLKVCDLGSLCVHVFMNPMPS